MGEPIRLRVDPWETGFGASMEAFGDAEEQAPEVDLGVEPVEWRPVRPGAAPERPTCVFVDGVRRIDVRLFAETPGGDVAPALAGAYAVGAAWCDDAARVEGIEVRRLLIVGAGHDAPEFQVLVGGQPLPYDGLSVGGRSPRDPLQKLQDEMRRAEGDLARELLRVCRPDLLVVDGPLSFEVARGAIVALVKRQMVDYLPPERMVLVSDLKTGERTPLFRIMGQKLERYAWYARLGVGRPIDGTRSGIVRLEVPVTLGLARSRELADLASAALPRFASRVGRDPRAPQNLYPVGQLETVLRHRLGDSLLIRRAVEAALWSLHD